MLPSVLNTGLLAIGTKLHAVFMLLLKSVHFCFYHFYDFKGSVSDLYRKQCKDEEKNSAWTEMYSKKNIKIEIMWLPHFATIY